MALGILLSQLHALAAHTTAPVVLDTDAAVDLVGYNLILLGGPAHNAVARKLFSSAAVVGAGGEKAPAPPALSAQGSGFPPVRFFSQAEGGGFGLGGHVWSAVASPNSTLLAVLPLSRGGCIGSASTWEELVFSPLDSGAGVACARLALLLAPQADTLEHGIEAIARAALPTIPPMVRAPFSNLFPDFMVLDAGSLPVKGWGAVQAAGSWGEDWGVAPTSFFS